MNEIIIKITQGNLNNNHLYLTEAVNQGFFPKEVIGGANKSLMGREVLVSMGVNGKNQFYTDIAGDKKILETDQI